MPVSTLIPEHDRYPGVQGPFRSVANRALNLFNSLLGTTSNSNGDLNIINIRHPEYDLETWTTWRAVYQAGDTFVEDYTKKFSKREEIDAFNTRKEITPIPAFAKSTINEIKNSIFQRMTDTTRVGGGNTYQESTKGRLGGVDLKGSKMSWFIGHNVVPELLTMAKVGVYVDMPELGPTLLDKGNKHPYLYIYRRENILSWTYAQEGEQRVLKSLLLREAQYIIDPKSKLPTGSVDIYRLVWINDFGTVSIQFYDKLGAKIGDQIDLSIKKIPFVIFELSNSLLEDVARHQIALLNLESSDVSYCLLANYPFYTEQFDAKSASSHLKTAQEQYQEENCTPNQNPAAPKAKATSENEITVGTTQGRKYPIGAERPGFISPSTEPLKASMEKQRNLKEDIRKLVHLSLSNIQPKMASAESKAVDKEGLESGLSYIGLELEHGERQIAEYWSMYENTPVPEIEYPQLWSLESEEERRKQAKELEEIRDSVPSLTFQKQVTKRIAKVLIGNKVSIDTLSLIEKEIDNAPTITSDSAVIIQDLTNGLVSKKTASTARGYKDGEVEIANKEHIERLTAIQKAQAPEIRGVPDTQVTPNQVSKDDKIDKPSRGEEK